MDVFNVKVVLDFKAGFWVSVLIARGCLRQLTPEPLTKLSEIAQTLRQFVKRITWSSLKVHKKIKNKNCCFMTPSHQSSGAFAEINFLVEKSSKRFRACFQWKLKLTARIPVKKLTETSGSRKTIKLMEHFCWLFLPPFRCQAPCDVKHTQINISFASELFNYLLSRGKSSRCKSSFRLFASQTSFVLLLCVPPPFQVCCNFESKILGKSEQNLLSPDFINFVVSWRQMQILLENKQASSLIARLT